MEAFHNYKLKPGLKKDGEGPGVLSIHYNFLPFLLFDAKGMMKTHRSVQIYLRGWDKKVAELYSGDSLTYETSMMTEEEYMEGVPGQVAQWQKYSKDATTADQKTKYDYLSRVCESVMRCEYHTFMRELLDGSI